MFKRMIFLMAISLLVLVWTTGIVPAQVQSSPTTPSADPWLQKPILPYLLLTQDSRLEAERQDLYEALHLSAKEIKALQEIAGREQQTVKELYQASQKTLFKASSSADKEQAVLTHNQGVSEAMAKTDRAVRQLLGSRYPVFRTWIREWWTRERETISRLKQPRPGESPGIQSSAYSCYMFATQYHGYTNYEVALPDKYVKFANLDWYIPPPYDSRYNNPPYTVNIHRNGHWVWNVLVREVGPWNIDDNYWDSASGSNPRRMFSDIPLCWSEAEYAYYYGYNGGKDQFGRTVTVPTSVDLTPSVAADLGLRYLENSWLTVYYFDLP